VTSQEARRTKAGSVTQMLGDIESNDGRFKPAQTARALSRDGRRRLSPRAGYYAFLPPRASEFGAILVDRDLGEERRRSVVALSIPECAPDHPIHIHFRKDGGMIPPLENSLLGQVRVTAVITNTNSDASTSVPKPSSTISLSRSGLIGSSLRIPPLPNPQEPLRWGWSGRSALHWKANRLRIPADEHQREWPANHLSGHAPLPQEGAYAACFRQT
jgi:hypothetical protein